MEQNTINRKSWAIKNEVIFDDLVRLVNLTFPEIEIMVSLREQAQAIAPVLSEAFYQRLLAHPLTAEFVLGQIEARKSTLEQWFLDLFCGNYDHDYIRRRLRIGEVHVRIGLPIRYPLAMVDIILEKGLEVAATHTEPEQAQQAFRKLLALDMAVFNQAYEDVQLNHLAELIGNERLARRLLQE